MTPGHNACKRELSIRICCRTVNMNHKMHHIPSSTKWSKIWWTLKSPCCTKCFKAVIDSNPSKLAKVVQQMRNYYKRMCNSPQEPSWERVQRRYLIGQANSQLITLSDVATLIGKEHKKLHMEPRHFVRRLSYQPIELLNKPDLKSTKC